MTESPAHSSKHVAALNGLDEDGFTATLGDIFEHSPWVARRAAKARPFKSLEQLHAQMLQVVRHASIDEQLGLLRAHPELAGREAQAGTLTAASTAEQSGAGLHALTPEEMSRVSELNRMYRARFGFPFIIAVGENTKRDILTKWASRLHHDTVAELAVALEQVGIIARLRLNARFGDAAP